jgi:7-carboxy-7-deazaguanine synthase
MAPTPNGSNGYTVDKSTECDEIAEEYKLHPEWTYDKLPITKTGCDSYASWHKGFKDLSPMMSVDVILREMEITRQENDSYINNNGSSHLVITGGEPLLGWQQQYPELLKKAKDIGYRQVTFETNGTQEIKDDLHDYLLTETLKSDVQHRITFSVSPKLLSSGEPVDKTLQPKVVASYMKYGTVYLKFVVSTHDDMHLVNAYVDEYRRAGWHGEVYLMPSGGDPEVYHSNTKKVAEMAMFHGYRYSPRLQVDLWKNAWGT